MSLLFLNSRVVISAKVCSIFIRMRTINPKLLHDCSIFSHEAAPWKIQKSLHSRHRSRRSKERFFKEEGKEEGEGDDKKNETARQITQLGLKTWLDRLLPLFEKMNKNVVTLYFNPTQMSLVLRPEETGGVDAHADVSIFDNSNANNNGQTQNQIIFEQKSYVCSSAVKNQIAFKVDSNGLLRVVKGLVNVNATGAHVKLLRREHKRRKDDTDNKTNNNNKGNLTPVLCFSSFRRGD